MYGDYPLYGITSFYDDTTLNSHYHCHEYLALADKLIS